MFEEVVLDGEQVRGQPGSFAIGVGVREGGEDGEVFAVALFHLLRGRSVEVTILGFWRERPIDRRGR